MVSQAQQGIQISPIAVTVEDGARMTGFSRAFLYRHLDEIGIIKVGRATRIPVANLERWIARLAEEQDPNPRTDVPA